MHRRTMLILLTAAALASGLWGIENKLKLGEPVKGNAYAKQHADRLQLPRTLMEAAERLKQSKSAKELFGKAFVDVRYTFGFVDINEADDEEAKARTFGIMFGWAFR